MPTDLQLLLDNLRFDIRNLKISGLDREKLRQRINQIEKGIETLTQQGRGK